MNEQLVPDQSQVAVPQIAFISDVCMHILKLGVLKFPTIGFWSAYLQISRRIISILLKVVISTEILISFSAMCIPANSSAKSFVQLSILKKEESVQRYARTRNQ